MTLRRGPLADIVHRMSPITLAELNTHAELMTRFDTKYFVPRHILADLLRPLDNTARVLEIAGLRSLHYRTVYFDSSRFQFYRDHVQRRRHRFKVRTRTYSDTGGCMLEVKSKGYRGSTVKQRIDHDPAHTSILDRPALSFIESITGGGTGTLTPVVETRYRRTTVAVDDQRITVDLALECAADGTIRYGPDDALVETKSAARSNPFDLALRAHGIRPHTVSKYCVGAALLYPHLPSNPWHRTLERYFDC